MTDQPQTSVEGIDTNSTGFMPIDAFRAKLQEASGEESSEPENKPVDEVDETEAEAPDEIDEESENEEESQESKSVDDDEDIKDGDRPIPRKRVKKLERQRDEYKEELIKYKTRYESLLEGIESFGKTDNKGNKAEPEKEEEFIPLDPEADAVYNKKLEELERQLQETKQATAAAQFASALERQESEFKAKNPDFEEAYKHVVKIKKREMEHALVPEEQRDGAVFKIMQQLALRAVSQGKNAAELFYNMAEDYGYSRKAATKNGANLNAIRENQKKSRSINEFQAADTKPALSGAKEVKDMLNQYGQVDPAKFKVHLENLKKSYS